VQPGLSQLVSHYNERYYMSGHGGFQPDPNYFRLLGRYWRKRIYEDTGRDPDAPILDFGAGLGLVTSACPNVVCVEPSEFASAFLTQLGRPVYASLDLLPALRRTFRYILLHHVLEHLLDPAATLQRLHEYCQPGGELLIVLPFEKQGRRPSASPDMNRHLYCWTFQTLHNLLDACGWFPVWQGLLLNPCGLRSLRTILRLSEEAAVRWAGRLGRLTRFHRSIFVISREEPPQRP